MPSAAGVTQCRASVMGVLHAAFRSDRKLTGLERNSDTFDLLSGLL
jgi:hypothetical protein